MWREARHFKRLTGETLLICEGEPVVLLEKEKICRTSTPDHGVALFIAGRRSLFLKSFSEYASSEVACRLGNLAT